VHAGEWLAVRHAHLGNPNRCRALFAESASRGMSRAEERWSDEVVRLLTRLIETGVAARACANDLVVPALSGTPAPEAAVGR